MTWFEDELVTIERAFDYGESDLRLIHTTVGGSFTECLELSLVKEGGTTSYEHIRMGVSAVEALIKALQQGLIELKKHPGNLK